MAKAALKRKGKGAPPPLSAGMDNLSKPASGATVPFQLKIDPEMRRDFKGYAVAHDIDYSALFGKVWEYYKEHHG